MSTHLSKKKESHLRNQINEIVVPKNPIDTGVQPRLTSLPGIRAVLFDVYGTILISGFEPTRDDERNDQEQAVKETWDALGVTYRPPAPAEAIELMHETIGKVHLQKRNQGIDHPEVDIISVWTDILINLQRQGLISGFDTSLIPDFITGFVSRYDNPWLMPGLEETLETIQNQNLKTGIISNSQFYTPLTLEALTNKTIEEMGFNPNLLFWSYAEDIAKPSVRFYEIAKSRLSDDFGIQPEEVLFVGNDMLNDVYPAQEAGFKTALFAGDERSLRLREDDERCKNIAPDIQVTHLLQILDCLE